MAVIELNGKVALVTGSARRVGKTIALELARNGMHQVIHHNTSEAEAQATAKEVRALGVDAIVVQADQTLPDDVRRLLTTVRQRFQRLDLLVNSASIFERDSFTELSLERWQRTLALNLTGPFLCSQQAVPLMRESGGGSIINILDMTVFKPSKNYPAHSVSKAGLATLTTIMAQSLAPEIRVNGIAPGPVLRDEGNSVEQWEAIGKRLPLQHTGDPSDVAQAVVFLASQPFITGEILRVDGGDLIR